MIKSFILKRWKLLTIIFVILGVIFFVFVKNKNKEIKTANIQKGKIAEELILSGEINATNYAKLAFETSGKIVYVGVKEGENVKKGKLLSKLDTTILNSNYQIALSNLRTYDATVENVHDQVKNHATDETYAQKDLRTTAEANKDKAYEAVIQAKKNLDGASLYAPFNGIVTYILHPFTGVYTTLGVTEVEIIDPSTMHFLILADQTEVTKLLTGQKVIIVLDSFETQEFEGLVDNISFVPKTGESGSTYSIKVTFKNVDLINLKFKIAMSGDAKFIITEKDNVLFIPTNFVKQDKTGSYIKIDKGGKKVYIKTGIESEDNTEIIGNIKEGQTVYD